ncbi:helix-turn-helix domain-containing protein [Microbacterium suaedae]|uniref:helix-turn-helix domain-containing protein n=1 Tax=Microbacterium suaedae TaxID=2067813 RepID=UPI0013A62148|nr:helix-turn-helix domain-containing protein [Microbacterium suaedae]
MTDVARSFTSALERVLATPDEPPETSRSLPHREAMLVSQLQATLAKGRRQEQTSRLLFDTASAITEAHDIDEILQRVCARTRSLLVTDMAYVSLNDASTGETYIRTTDGIVTDTYRQIRMPFGSGILGQAAAGGSTYAMSSDYSHDDSFPHLPHIDAAVAEEGVVSILGTMLRTSEGVIGALMIADRSTRVYSSDVIALLQQIAALASVALQRATYVDSLTDALAERDRAREEADSRLLALERLQRFDHDLLELLRNDRPLTSLIDALSSHLGAEVALLRAAELEGVHRAARRTPWVHDCDGRATTLMHAVAGRRVLGAIEVRRALGEDDARLLERGAGVLSAMLLHDERRHEADRKLQDQLVSGIETADQTAWPTLSRRLAPFGLLEGSRVHVLSARGPGNADVFAALRPLVESRGGVIGEVGGTVRIVSGDVGPDDAARILNPGTIHAAISGVSTTFARQDLARAVATTERAVRAMRALGEIGFADPTRELGLAGLALSHLPDATASRLAESALGPLLAYDRKRGSDLVTTARTLLDNDADAVRAAEVLYLHPNTVRQRMRRIDDLLGPSWRHGARRSELHIALRIWHGSIPPDRPDPSPE